MASNKTNIKELPSETLVTDINQAKQELGRIKFDHASKGVSDTRIIGETKKDIARMLTEVRAREINAMTPEQIAKRDRIRLRRK